MEPKKIAIIGAGVSGLAASWALRNTNAVITVFEKSHGVSGRAASRTKNGVRFDHGANYFRTTGKAVSELIHEQLPTDDLVRIEKDVWTFDETGQLSPGDPKINSEPKWTYTSGISTLGKLLQAASVAELKSGVRVRKLDREKDLWRLTDWEGKALGTFDAVLMTAPAPQSAEIINASGMPPAIGSRLFAALGGVRFHRQISAVLGIDGEVERPGDFYALVNTDRKHDIVWLSFENDKAGHVPKGQTVLVAQMSPEWSLHNFEEPIENVIEHVTEAAALLLHCDLPIAWSDCQRWKFAHPFSTADQAALAEGESKGLFFAGDSLVGKGRVHRALETGLEAGCRMHGFLRLDPLLSEHP